MSAAYNLGVALTRAGKREEGQAGDGSASRSCATAPYKSALGSTYLEQGTYAEALASTGAEPEAVDAEDAGGVARREAATGAGCRGGAPATPARRARAGRPRRRRRARRGRGRAGGRCASAATSGGRLRRRRRRRPGLAGVAARRGGGRRLRQRRAARPARARSRPGSSLFHNEGGGPLQGRDGGRRLPAWPHAAADAPRSSTSTTTATSTSSWRPPPRQARPSCCGTTATAPSPTSREPRSSAAPARRSRSSRPTSTTAATSTCSCCSADAARALPEHARRHASRTWRRSSGLAATGPFRCAAAGDVNKDGYTDFFLGGGRARPALALSDGRGGVHASSPRAAGGRGRRWPRSSSTTTTTACSTSLVVTAKGLRLLRNLGRVWADVSAAALPAALRDGGVRGRRPRRSPTSTATATRTRSSRRRRRLRLLDERAAATATARSRVQLAGRVSNQRRRRARRSRCAPAACARSSRPRAAVPMAAPADVVFGLGARDGARRRARDLAVGHRADRDRDGRRRPSRAAARRARRRPSSTASRRPARTSTPGTASGSSSSPTSWAAARWATTSAPGRAQRARPRRVRAHRARAARAARRPLRAARDQRARGGAVPRPRCSSLAVDHPADVEVYPDEGMTDAAEAVPALRGARPAHAAGDRRPRARRDARAWRELDRAFVDELPARAHPRLREGARADPRPLGAARGRTRCCCSPAGPTTRSRATTWPRTRPASPLAPPRLEVERADGRGRRRSSDIGIPVGRPQTIVVDLAGQARARRAASASSRTCASTGTRPRSRRRRRRRGSRPRPLEPLRADLARARLLGRGEPGRPRAAGATTTRACRALSPWKTMPGRYTREGDVRALLAAADDVFVVSKPGDEVALCFDATALPPLAAGLDADLPAHGDGFSKEMDINSASPDVVLPLPFHGMKAYPYADADVPPRSVRRSRAARPRRWNTRAGGRARSSPIELSPSPTERRVTGHDPLLRRRLPDRPAEPARPGRDAGEHRPHAVDDRLGGGRRGAVPAGAARRVPRVRPRGAGLRDASRSCVEKLAVPDPERAHRPRCSAKAKEHGIYIQSGTMIEADPRWPGVVFNTTCLIGPAGILYKYRKVNPWIPYEVHASPHDVPGYDEPLFPVADTEIGRIGCAICYDWLFPEAHAPARDERRRGAGARLGLHGPVGRHRADGLVDGRQPLPRAREHGLRRGRQPGRAAAPLPAVLVAGRQHGRGLRRPHPRPGLAGPGRADRRRRRSTSPRCATSARRGAATTCSRTCAREAYPVYRGHVYPPAGAQRPALATRRTTRASTRRRRALA